MLDIAALDTKASLSLHSWLRYTTDSDCKIATPSEVSSCKRLHPLNLPSVNFGFSNETYWFVATLKNSAIKDKNIYLDVGYSMLDEVSLWLFSASDEELYQFDTGDMYPFSQRPVDASTFVFPLIFPAEQTVKVVIRVRSTSSLQVPIRLSNKEVFVKEKVSTVIFVGLLLGALLIMSLHNMVVYFSLKDKSYLYFSFAIACVLITCSILAGLAYPYFWPNAPQWNSISLLVMANLALVGLTKFTVHFLSLQGRTRKILNATAITSITLIGLSLVLGHRYYHELVMITALMVICAPSVAYLASIIVWLEGRSSARFYVVAFTGYTITVYFWVSSKFGVVNNGFFIDNSIYLAALVAILLLSLALADRMNYEKKAKHLAQLKSISALERYRDLFESSLEGMFRINSKGKIHSVNAAFAQMLGFADKQELLNSITRLDNLIPHSFQEGRTIKRELLTNKKIRSYDVQCSRINGEIFWGTVNARLVQYVNSGNYFVEGSIIDTTERKRVEQELSYMANHDGLTGLVNRSAFENMLTKELLSLAESKSQHAMIFIDMDRFKLVNDTCGHIAGDKLLQQVAEIFVRNVRRPDVVARIGGDEFAIFLKNCPMEKAGEVAFSIRQELGDFKFVWQENYFNLSASMGVIAVHDPGLTIKELFRRSDTACLEAKESGRNRVVMHSEHRDSLNLRKNDTQIVSVIQDAIEHDHFSLYQHSILGMGESKNSCYEVLLRLHHNDKILRPGAFMSAAERYNLMAQIDRWVISHYFKWLAANPDEMASLTMASINISAFGLADKSLLEDIKQWIPLYNIDASKICFEITESVALSSIADTVKFIETMKKLGVKFALDDFGSGYASYSYLTKLPVDFVKVDGSFVHDVDVNSINYAIVRSIVDVAHVMNLKVIAEFIESENVLGKLKEIGVDFFQGYHIAEPVPLIKS